MKFHLVDDWKTAWKWFSMNCMVVAAAIQGTWAWVPSDMRRSIPHGWVEGLTVVVLVLGVIGRLLKQGDNQQGDEANAVVPDNSAAVDKK